MKNRRKSRRGEGKRSAIPRLVRVRYKLVAAGFWMSAF
jgi:hypothetical protein